MDRWDLLPFLEGLDESLAPTLLLTSSPRYAVEHWHEVDLPAPLLVLSSYPLLSLQLSEDRWCATFRGTDDVPALVSRGSALATDLAALRTPRAHLGATSGGSLGTLPLA